MAGSLACGRLANVLRAGGRIDLHIHTCYSDGQFTPGEIVRRYREAEYDCIAITDHDTVDGIAEALAAGKAAGLDVIPGIELATLDGEAGGVHILGYGVDPENGRLTAKLEEVRAARRERNDRLIRCLADMGYPLTYDELLVGKRGDYIGKPDFGRAMVRRGYLKTPKEVFTPGKYLESPAAKKIEKKRMNTEDAVALIAETGGVPVLAHPIQIKGLGVPGSEPYFAALEAFVERLIQSGLRGIEAYHPDHNAEQAVAFAEMAARFSLIVTRGSDFHGEDFIKPQK